MIEVRLAKAPVLKAVIEPGGALLVGRTERAGLVVPDDRAMSAVHCEIRWDGERCRVIDHASLAGTFVDGKRVTEADIGNGGWIRAGDTVLSVYLEAATPPPAERGLRGDGTDPWSPSQEQALAALQAEQAPLFAVLDAARTERVLQVLRESVETYRSLFEGRESEGLALQAPYLVRLPRGSRLLEQTVLEGWGERWGIYLCCRRPFDEVRRQLRRSLMVKREATEKRMYFRFYDPEVLRLFLPTCSLRQREQIFGEIEAFVVEGRHGEVLKLAHEAPAAAMGTEPGS
jgi:hypothetical protein